MASRHPGVPLRTNKVVKSGTASTKNHRFESFNQRISRLSIDPVRKDRKKNIQEEGYSIQSYFRAALDRWKDLNLSENFTAFAREIDPLCNSLPQILHHQARILETLLLSAEKSNHLSLEPLLDLLSSLAHDLGARFEEYYPRAIDLVVNLVLKHTEVEVIEWSFNCLVWLFKYLSRLLVSDIRPTLHIIVPLLGKGTRKGYITRFAAEALAFLVRKTAIAWPKDTKPLSLAVQGIAEELSSSRDIQTANSTTESFKLGLMRLLLASMKGVDRRLHSCSPYLYSCLLQKATVGLQQEGRKIQDLEGMLYGTTVAIVHHTDADSLRPLLDIILEKGLALSSESQAGEIRLYGRLLFLASSVRQGSRVHNWDSVLETTLHLMHICGMLKEDSKAADEEVLKAVAVSFQNAPQETVIAKFRSFLESFSTEVMARSFLSFCSYFHDLNSNRFLEFLLPAFAKFITSSWHKHRSELYLMLPTIFSASSQTSLFLHETWVQDIRKKIDDLHQDDIEIVECFSFLELVDRCTTSSTAVTSLTESVACLIKNELDCYKSSSSRSIFSFGAALRFYAQSAHVPLDKIAGVWPKLCSLIPQYGNLAPFLEAMLALVQKLEGRALHNGIAEFIDSLSKNLSAPSHTIRRLSLQILKEICVLQTPEHLEVLHTCLTIENTTIDVSATRSISLQLRKLLSLSKHLPEDHWLSKLTPIFCFGITTYKLAQAKTDAIVALKELCDNKANEGVVAEICFSWLHADVPTLRVSSDTSQALKSPQLTEFECSNARKVDSLIDEKCSQLADPDMHLSQRFHHFHDFLPKMPADAPIVALQVLFGNPNIAEKHSRQLVPVFLSSMTSEDSDRLLFTTADGTQGQECGEEISGEGISESTQQHNQDFRKAMLKLFGSFKNPSVLYESSEVYKVLNDLLTSGNTAIQKAALTAILAWKQSDLLHFRENLQNLLDDAKFRDEITILPSILNQESQAGTSPHSVVFGVFLRLLYGRMISNSGSSKNDSKSAGKHLATLQAIARLGDGSIEDFIRIALGPLEKIAVLDGAILKMDVIEQDLMPLRKQLGLMRLISRMIQFFGTQIAPFSGLICHGISYCLLRSNRLISAAKYEGEGQRHRGSHFERLKSIRQEGLLCLRLLIINGSFHEIQPCVKSVFSEVISPHLPDLPIETAQSVSGPLRLMSTLAASSETVFSLHEYDHRTLRIISECLLIPSAKEDVVVFVLNDIFKKIAILCVTTTTGDGSFRDEDVYRGVLEPTAGDLMEKIKCLLERNSSRAVLTAAIEFVSILAPLIKGFSTLQSMFHTLIFLLKQPPHEVSPRTKGDLLQIIRNFLPMVIDGLSDIEFQDLWTCICTLFGYFKDRRNREVVSQVLLAMSMKDKSLENVGKLCISLNSFSQSRLDEPDFDQRLEAFRHISEFAGTEFSPREWNPILHNLLFYVKDEDEMALRTSASHAIRCFIEANRVDEVQTAEALYLVREVLLPAVRNGASTSSELVRVEYLTIMACLTHTNPSWEEVHDLVDLLMEGDDEASFFTNILHIQHHRRTRALRRLTAKLSEGSIQSTNVARFLNPLIEHFIFSPGEDENTHNLRAEAINTIGQSALSLKWPQFRAMLRRYIKYLESKPNLQKSLVKLLGVVIDALAAALKENEKSKADKPLVNVGSTLSKSLPGESRLVDDLSSSILSSLVGYIHDKDESTVSLRVPVAISLVKVLRLLPASYFTENLPPILTDICHILRSRSQESRDLTRKTLAEISILIGPTYFGFVLKELRNALTRGYQLHVLSFSVHSILVAITPSFQPGDLSYCVCQIVGVIMDDTFGKTGQEKDTEEYISKMKEVKSSKSFDSMELVARVSKLEDLPNIIQPIQALLEEKLDIRAVRKVDELLRRIGIGIMMNEEVRTQRILKFCHEVIQSSYNEQNSLHVKGPESDRTQDRFLIDYHGAQARGQSSTSSYGYKLAKFGFDILRSIFQRNNELLTASNFAGFLPLVGDALVQTNEEVQISALRLLTVAIKVPLASINANAALYIAESVKMIKNSSSTSVEHAQAALKLITAILRERKDIIIRESNVAYLLKRLVTDIEQPDKQGITFNFLKAVMARKIMVAELYEIMDVVAVMMVTNQTKSARDFARGAYFRFIMDYPQSRDRFSKQMSFLIKNLEYKHQEGRKSVLEAVHLLFTKTGDNMTQEIFAQFFVPLIMAMSNDESSECREMAGALLRISFERADTERLQSFLQLLESWLLQSDRSVLNRLALEVYGIFFDARDSATDLQVDFVLSNIAKILKTNLKDYGTSEWETLYFAMQTLSKICHNSPSAAFESNRSSIWVSLRQSLEFPHLSVKSISAKLLGVYFADFARTNAKADSVTNLPLTGSGGLQFSGAEILETTRVSLALLKSTATGEELASQNVRNLVFLGKIMIHTSLDWQKHVEPKPLGSHSKIELKENNFDESDTGSEDSGQITQKQPQQKSRPAIIHIIHTTCHVLRQPPTNTADIDSLLPHHSSLNLLATLTSHLPDLILATTLPTIILPLHNLTDNSIPTPASITPSFNTSYKSLQTHAHELMNLLQKRLGATEYAQAMQKVQQNVKDKREERRGKRRVEAVAEPERAGDRKRKKLEKKKEGRKKRALEFGRRRKGL